MLLWCDSNAAHFNAVLTCNPGPDSAVRGVVASNVHIGDCVSSQHRRGTSSVRYRQAGCFVCIGLQNCSSARVAALAALHTGASFTTASVGRLVRETFEPENTTEVSTFGEKAGTVVEVWGRPSVPN